MPDTISTGTDARVNSYTSGDQTEPSVGVFADGGSIIVWESNGQDGSNLGVYGQLYDANGQAVGPEFRVDNNTSGDQYNPSVAVMTDGSFVVGWLNGTTLSAQRYSLDANGEAQKGGSELTVATGVSFDTRDDEAVNVSALADGGFSVGWHFPWYSSWVRMYDADNNTTVNTFRFGDIVSDTTLLSNGNVLITSSGWKPSGDGSGTGVIAQIRDADGNVVKGQFLVNTVTGGNQERADAAAFDNGATSGFIVTWGMNNNSVQAAIYDDNGNVLYGDFNIATGLSGLVQPEVVSLADGTVFVMWEKNGDIYGQRLDPSTATLIGGNIVVHTDTSGTQAEVDVAANPDGTLTVTWQSNASGNVGYDIETRVLDLGISVENEAPIAGNVDLGAVDEDSSIVITEAQLLANSSDANQGDVLSVLSVSVDGAYGSITDNGDRTWTYTPAADYNGTDVELNFVISDSELGDTGTAVIDVTAANDAPIADNVDISSTATGAARIFTAAQLLANASDIDGDTMSVTAVSVEADYGTITDNGDGTWTFVSVAGYVGDNVEIAFTVSDGALTADGTAFIDVYVPDQDHRVNSYTSGDQTEPSVGVFADGSTIIVWESSGQDGSGMGVYGQLYDANGQAVGPEFRVDNDTNGDQYNPSVAVMTDGSFVIGWLNGTTLSAQRYSLDANGEALKAGSELTVATGVSVDTRDDEAVNVSALADGGFSIGWHFPWYSSWVRMYDGNDNTTVNTYRFGDIVTDTTVLANGNILVTSSMWEPTGDSSGTGVIAQILDADGNVVKPQFIVNTVTSGNQERADATAFDDGLISGFIVTWGLGNNSVQAAVYDDFGLLLVPDFTIATGLSGYVQPEVVTLADGTVLIMWDQGGDIHGQRVEATTGSLIGSDFIVHSSTDGTQGEVDAVANPDGTLTLVWHSNGSGNDGYDIETRVLDLGITGVDPDHNATFSGEDSGAVTEEQDPDNDGLLEVSGQLLVSDPDAGEAAIQPVTIVGTYGELTIDAAGNWSYAADNTQSAIQALDDGGLLVDRITVLSVDGTSHNITITINGADSAVANTEPQVIELLSSNSALDFSLGFEGVSLVDTVSNGSLTFGAEGTISYTPTAGYVGQDGFTYQDADGVVREVVISVGEDLPVEDTLLAQPVYTQNQKFHQLSMEALPGGGYLTVTAWQHESINGHSEVLLQIYDANGNALLPDNGVQVNQVGPEDQFYAEVSAASDGTIAVTWMNAVDGDSPPDYDVMARMYDANGTPLGNEFVVAQGDQESDLSHINSQKFPDITHLSDDGFVVVGETISALSGHPHEVWVRAYNSDGSADISVMGGVKTTIFSASDGNYTNAQVSALADGGFIVIAIKDGSDIVSLSFDAAGNQTASQTLLASSAPTDIGIESLENGDYVVYWTGSDADGKGVFAQLYAADGTLIKGTYLVNTANQSEDQYLADVTSIEGGGFMIAWQSDTGVIFVNGEEDSGVYAQQFDGFGNAIGDTVEVANENRRAPEIVELESGQIYVGMLSHRIIVSGTSYEDNLNGAEIRPASELNDWAEGTSSHDLQYGLGGNDVLKGYGGTDILVGGTGDDSLYGGDGLDTITGGAGDDLIDGGDGPDTIVFTGAFADYQITDNGGGNGSITDLRAGSPDGTDILVSAEHLQFTDLTTNKLPVVGDIALTPSNEDVVVTITEATLLASTTDPDGDALSVTSVSLVDESVGTLVDNGDGTWTYTPTAHYSADAVQISFVVDDGYDTVVGNATLDIVAVADAPTITSTPAIGDEDTVLALDISVALVDIDGSETLTSVALSDIPEGWTLSDGTNDFTSTGLLTSVDVTHWNQSTLTLAPSEHANGQVNLTVTAVVTEISNADTAQTVTLYPVTVTPVNDPATISGTATGDVIEDADTLLEVSGILAVSDVDTGEEVFIAGTQGGIYGSLTIDVAGNWSYSADNSQAAIQNLAAGSTLTDTITVSSYDGTATEDIVITITGTNDAPVLSGDVAGSVIEDSQLSAGGTLSHGDIDGGDSHTWTIVGDLDLDGTLAGSYGSLSLTQAGDWSYALDNSAAQSLAAGETVIESFTISIDDGDGSTDSQQIDIGITGVNDAAVIGGVATGVVTEDNDPDVDGLLETAGILTVSDTDAGEASFTAETVTGTYGDLMIDAAGNWSYAADNTQAAIQSLVEGDTLTDIISVTALDGTSQDVVITITGSN
ncbi:MAG: VCBS domain-containing protein, partial [Gammaproteobacteria bacterium]|nr:VCBS domain-containing protein [Gammaproteobacteria bacterium]